MKHDWIMSIWLTYGIITAILVVAELCYFKIANHCCPLKDVDVVKKQIKWVHRTRQVLCQY